MAEFRPFDLGTVIQTAEAIGGIRQQKSYAKLQEKYLGQRMEQGEAEETRAKAKFSEEQRVANTQWLVGASEQVLSLPDDQQPAAAAALFEEGKKRGIVAPDAQMPQYNPEGLRQFSANAKVTLGKMSAPQSAQGKVAADVKGGFLTEDQGAVALAPKDAKNPTSYDEYVRAQKDPEFASFLKSRKGKGLSVTLPDGTVVEMGGDGGGVKPDELAKPTINNLQETIVKSSDRLDRLNSTLSTYRPEFLKARGMLDANATRVKEFVGMDASPEDKKFLADYTSFKTSAAQDLTATLKDLSGAAVTPQEYERAEKSAPSGKELSPTEFESKARATTKFITRSIMRANWALKNGIGVKSVDELSKRMPLDGIDGVYEARANQLWQELGGTPEAKKQAIQQANQEFGLARAK